MTVDEYFEKHPEVKQKFDDEIRNDNWGYWRAERNSYLAISMSVKNQ
jgi:hypothetical protein